MPVPPLSFLAHGRLGFRRSVLAILLCGGTYGLVMGTFGGVAGDRWHQPIFAAIKVPLLLGATFGLAWPGFFVLNTLTGLRADVGRAMRAVASAQAGVAVTLASLAPFTALLNVSTHDYGLILLFNGLMFLIAAGAGQLLIRRAYRPLIAADRRHRTMLAVWSVAFCFIAIQMAWVLRPFVGGPGEKTTMFRPVVWGNAYEVVGKLIWNKLV